MKDIIKDNSKEIKNTKLAVLTQADVQTICGGCYCTCRNGRVHNQMTQSSCANWCEELRSSMAFCD